MTGFKTVVDSFVALHEIVEDKLGNDRAYGLPALSVTPILAEKPLKEISNDKQMILHQTDPFSMLSLK